MIQAEISREEYQIYFSYKEQYYANHGIKNIEQLYLDIYNKTGQISHSPIQVGLNITDRCNLSCLHCSKRNSNSNDMKNWRQIIGRLVSLEVCQFYITGGEPLCNPELADILNYIKSQKRFFKLLTNGTIDLHRIIRDVKFMKFDSVQISLDDVGEEYGTLRVGGNFTKVKKNIQLLTANTVEYSINMVVHDHNYMHMKTVYLFCLDNGVKQIRFTPINEHSNTNLRYTMHKNIFKAFCEVLRINQNAGCPITILQDPVPVIYGLVALANSTEQMNIRSGRFECPALITSCEVSTSGDAYPCSFLDYPDLYFGNVLDVDFAEKWINTPIRAELHSRKCPIGCKDCKELSMCNASCPAASYLAFNTFDFGDSRCIIRGNSTKGP